MITVNARDDFARVLRENPDWVDTLHALLLSQELLKLNDNQHRRKVSLGCGPL